MKIPFLGGMGAVELIIILVVVLLIFGPKNLPKLGSAIGRTVKNLREGMDEKKNSKDAQPDAEAGAEPEAAADEAVYDYDADTEAKPFNQVTDEGGDANKA